MLLQISRGKKTRQFSSHQQSALLSLIFGRSSSAATWTALTNQQIRNSNTQPCNLLGKVPTSKKQPCSKLPIQVSSSGNKPRKAILQQYCNTRHVAAANQSGKEDWTILITPAVSSVELDIWKIILRSNVDSTHKPTNQQLQHSAMHPSRKNIDHEKNQPYSKRAVHVASSGIKPSKLVLQQSCNTPHVAGLIQNSSTAGAVHAAANQSGKED